MVSLEKLTSLSQCSAHTRADTISMKLEIYVDTLFLGLIPKLKFGMKSLRLYRCLI